MKLLLQQF